MKQKLMKWTNLRKNTIRFMLVVLLVVFAQINAKPAQAASITSFSDTMSRLKASTLANHEIKFVTPTGLTAAQTITITFSAGFTGVSSIAFGDVDFATGSTNNCTSAVFTEQTLAATASGATWGVASSGQVVTLTSGTGTVTADRCVRFRIGTNAVTGTTGTNQITNGATGASDTVAIAGTFGDTGTAAVEIITNDQITISATVDPTITFTLIDASASDNAIGFGTLTSSAARYANAASTGSATSVSAVTMTVATNASSGYVLTYNGATLTSGGNTITPATITADVDGSFGTSQFATAYSTSGSSTVVTSYAQASNNWDFAANTTTTIVSRTTPTNVETISGYYLANIPGSQAAGSYNTTLTYIATGYF